MTKTRFTQKLGMYDKELGMGIEPTSLVDYKEIIANLFLGSFCLLFSSPITRLAGDSKHEFKSDKLPALRENIAPGVLA
jgi:hypothetical protein